MVPRRGKRPECHQIPAACVVLRDQVFSGTPGEFRLPVLYSDARYYLISAAPSEAGGSQRGGLFEGC